jgi:VanZ family protein
LKFIDAVSSYSFFDMQDRRRQFVLYWLPPLVWMGVIFALSTGYFSSYKTGSVFGEIISQLFPWMGAKWVQRLHYMTRKMGHLTEYAILAVLWARALFRSGPWRGELGGTRLLWILGLVVLYASFDEWHQSWSSLRTGSALDVLIDGVGGAAGLVAWRFHRQWNLPKKSLPTP